MPRNKTKHRGKVVGTIAIYGTRDVGFHFLAHLGERVSEDAEGFASEGTPEKPTRHSEATSALWMALSVLERRGLKHPGLVVVHMDLPAGPRVALFDANTTPSFGELRWAAGDMRSLSKDDLVKAGV